MGSVIKLFPLTVKHIAKDDGREIMTQTLCLVPAGKRVAAAPYFSLKDWEAEQIVYIVDMPERPVTLEIKYRRVK